ncbi:palmitoyltransferase swf1 [Blastocladiella emersonii ATCC 22665]|nr:palmitoyltransferase swf1 [Blastocladiella emersonii ATCC 22665]
MDALPLLQALVWSVAVLIAVFIFLMLAGPSQTFRHTVVGRAHRFVSETVPAALGRVAHRVLGPRIVGWFARVAHWAGYERNPLVQIFYLGLVSLGTLMFMARAWDQIPNVSVSSAHKPFVLVSIAMAYITFFAACWSNPGRIDASNHAAHAALWEYDHVLYAPFECRTCTFMKPARSKHCSMTKSCIASFDHFCIWLNNAVGRNNQRHFIVFLASVAWVSSYVSYVSAWTVAAIMQRYGLLELAPADWWWTAQFFDYGYHYTPTGTQRVRFPVGWFTGLSNALLVDPILATLALFLALVGPLVLAFLAHHLWYNAWLGMTTNETHKWADVQWAIDHGEAWYAVVASTGELYLTNDAAATRAPAGAVPRHRYNLGFWRNLRELLWPAAVASTKPKVKAAAKTEKAKKAQ